MPLGVYILIGLTIFIFMEGVAWFAHKYIMHKVLWRLHKSHHVPELNKPSSFFEKNDWFFIIFAFPSMVCYILGGLLASWVLLTIAIGITLYGIAYFIFHEVVFHRRFAWFRNWDNAYVRAVRRAHSMHHRHLGAEDGECFGLLVFPYKYFKMELKSP